MRQNALGQKSQTSQKQSKLIDTKKTPGKEPASKLIKQDLSDSYYDSQDDDDDDYSYYTESRASRPSKVSPTPKNALQSKKKDLPRETSYYSDEESDRSDSRQRRRQSRYSDDESYTEYTETQQTMNREEMKSTAKKQAPSKESPVKAHSKKPVVVQNRYDSEDDDDDEESSQEDSSAEEYPVRKVKQVPPKASAAAPT